MNAHAILSRVRVFWISVESSEGGVFTTKQERHIQYRTAINYSTVTLYYKNG